MVSKHIHILSTRPVSDRIIADAASKSISVDTLSFIETEAILDNEVLDKIRDLSKQELLVIFTSMNAAEMVIQHLHQQKPAWKIFCMGNSTRLIIESHFGKHSIAALANDATQLARELVAWRYAAGDHSRVIFFCGDQRRDELPDMLKQHHIEVEEITSYKTILQHHVINKHYNAVLFFSPSAVHSFFTTNTPSSGTIYFAIGSTTAAAIRQYNAENIITGQTPSKDELMKEAIAYFSNKAVN